MSDQANAEPPEEIDPTAGWSAKRRAWETEMAANTKRALELLATLPARSVTVQGWSLAFKRNRGTAGMRARKRALWSSR